MSGGRWNYQSTRLEELAADLETNRSVFAELIKAVAETEHIVDWAESRDSSREYAEHQLYDLWVETFDRLYG